MSIACRPIHATRAWREQRSPADRNQRSTGERRVDSAFGLRALRMQPTAASVHAGAHLGQLVTLFLRQQG